MHVLIEIRGDLSYQAFKECQSKELLTVKLISTLLGLVHAIGEFGHLWHHVVELGRLSLSLDDDWEHGAASNYRA